MSSDSFGRQDRYRTAIETMGPNGKPIQPCDTFRKNSHPYWGREPIFGQTDIAGNEIVRGGQNREDGKVLTVRTYGSTVDFAHERNC